MRKQLSQNSYKLISCINPLYQVEESVNIKMTLQHQFRFKFIDSENKQQKQKILNMHFNRI